MTQALVSGVHYTFQYSPRSSDCKHSQLVVSWQWPGDVVQCGVDLCDGEHVPVYHLVVRTPAAATHTLVTLSDLQKNHEIYDES
jgi:hypothetical protein